MATGKENAEKPLEKMTVKELREVALEIPDLTGVHGMNKQDLLAAVKTHRGIAPAAPKKSDRSVRELKRQIRDLKAGKAAMAGGKNAKQAEILRRRLSRLKKKTRRAG